MKKHTILFMTSNPSGTDRLALDREARAVQVELERAGHRDCFEFETRWAMEPHDLLRELRKLKPTVVHFSGHGGRNVGGEILPDQAPYEDIQDILIEELEFPDTEQSYGLFFQGSDGQAKLVSASAIAETFGAAGKAVKLVVLNACYSEAQAKMLLAHVDCVVGTGGSISASDARNFAIGFYGGLGEGESVAAAYLQGRAAISLEGLLCDAELQLHVRDAVDADQLILAEARPESTTESGGPARQYSSLRFAAIAIDPRDQNWGLSQVTEWGFSPFKDPVRSRFQPLKFVHGADPLFDITLMNATGMPIILTAVGVEILRVAQRAIVAGIPTAAKIFQSDSYVIDMPDIRSRHFPILNRWGDFGPQDVTETIRESLPDPIYLELGAPYRYSLLLRCYAKHMPNWAQIRMVVSTDIGEYHSGALEMFH